MLWILRRTGAVNFFNSINNNYVGRSNSVNFYNGSDSGKYKSLIPFINQGMDVSQAMNERTNYFTCLIKILNP